MHKKMLAALLAVSTAAAAEKKPRDCYGPFTHYVDGKKVTLYQSGLRVLRRAEMPAVLIENGNILDCDSYNALATPEYRSKLAGLYADAITEYAEGTGIDTVFVDEGHPPHATIQGHGRCNGERVKETNLTPYLQNALVHELSERGFKTEALRYDGPVTRFEHIDHYIDTANNHAPNIEDTSVYVSMHVDQNIQRDGIPDIYVFCDRNQGSLDLAASIAKHVRESRNTLVK